MIRTQDRTPWWRRRIVDAWLGRPLLALWRLLDAVSPKHLDRWAFFVHPLKPGQFVENARAVFEQVRDDASIRKYVFLRAGQHPPGLEETAHVTVIALDTLAGLWALTRCGVWLLTNSTPMDLSFLWHGGGYAAPRPCLRRRVLVNLWHGVPLKRLFALAHPDQRRNGDRNHFRRNERRHYDGVVASSEIDSHAMAAIFHPLPPDRVWDTGLPRNDFLRLPEADLPSTLANELRQVRALRAGRTMVLYAPTYRDASVAASLCHRFDAAQTAQLQQLLRQYGAVLGVRGHYLRNAPAPFDADAFAGDTLLDLGHDRFHEIAPLLRESSLVVTDYSSVFIDALYLDLPVLSFAYDLNHYRQHQNGLLYDMDLAFPGPVTTDFASFLAALEAQLAGRVPRGPRYAAARRMFFRHDDAHNTDRLLQRLHACIAERRAR